MKCCITDCEKVANLFMGNNLMEGDIPLCNEHFHIFNKHLDAREKLFVKEERERILDMLKDWSETNYGNMDNRVEAMIKLQKKISQSNDKANLGVKE